MFFSRLNISEVTSNSKGGGGGNILSHSRVISRTIINISMHTISRRAKLAPPSVGCGPMLSPPLSVGLGPMLSAPLPVGLGPLLFPPLPLAPLEPPLPPPLPFPPIKIYQFNLHHKRRWEKRHSTFESKSLTNADGIILTIIFCLFDWFLIAPVNN